MEHIILAVLPRLKLHERKYVVAVNLQHGHIDCSQSHMNNILRAQNIYKLRNALHTHIYLYTNHDVFWSPYDIMDKCSLLICMLIKSLLSKRDIMGNKQEL